MPTSPTVRTDGIWLDRADDVALDVLLDGRRIWSFNPRRDARPEGTLHRVPWPRALAHRVKGIGSFTVREHVGGAVLIDGEFRLGAGEQRVRLVDAEGHPLAVDKTGALGREFSERDQGEIDALMDATERVLDFLRTECGVPGFLAFGGLLGAVRDGRLIGHDVDLDVSYLSRHTVPADIARESFRLERTFLRAGWKSWRFSANDFKVLAPGVRSTARWIDIFGAYVTDGMLYVMPTVAVEPYKVRIEPLGEVVLEGRRLPAPADPESLLEATYGPNWRVPDPSFKYAVPRAVDRRMDGWFRNAIANREHWLPFYEGPGGRRVPTEPSAFARWVADRSDTHGELVDVGCGTGRDSLWLSTQAYTVTGLDYAPPAVDIGRGEAAARGLDTRFEVFNLYDSRQVLAMGARLAHVDGPLDIYGRFLIHALNARGRDALWQVANMALRRRGRLYLEFRTGDDRNLTYEFGKHFRTYLTPDEVGAEIERRGGSVEYHEEGYGMAVYKNEDPLVCRMVATWQR
ncbi:MAG: class I SAM-dependent methyltransferase [Jatrophihabitans sp.]|uniref:class I SAM-dependent methyltransferase n=1 Tax=Jatrophihabitans sp. TaxID=1932789 RepID=UPI003F80F30D